MGKEKGMKFVEQKEDQFVFDVNSEVYDFTIVKIQEVFCNEKVDNFACGHITFI